MSHGVEQRRAGLGTNPLFRLCHRGAEASPTRPGGKHKLPVRGRCAASRNRAGQVPLKLVRARQELMYLAGFMLLYDVGAWAAP